MAPNGFFIFTQCRKAGIGCLINFFRGNPRECGTFHTRNKG